MSVIHVLNLLSEVIKRHQRGGPGRPDVITVVVEDLEAYRSVIDATILSAGGVLLDAEDYTTGTEGPKDSTLKTVVDTVLDIRRPGGARLRVNVEQTKSGVRATINGSEMNEVSSSSEKALSGVATVLFDKRLKEATLAVVTYEESVMEDVVADAVWQLFTKQLDNITLGRIRTLLVLVRASRVNYERHCAQGISLTYHLSENSIEERKGWNTNSTDISHLKPSNDRFLVLFLGAGFSASSGLPLGNKLRDEALGEFLNSDGSSSYSQSAEQFLHYIRDHRRFASQEEEEITLEKFRDSLTLERVLREELHRHKDPATSPTLLALGQRNDEVVISPGMAVRELHKIIKHSSHSLVVVTVNFDTLVEAGGNVKVFASEQDFENFPDYLRDYRENGGAVPLLKLHGTLCDFNTVVVTVDQTAKGLAPSKVRALRELTNPGIPVQWAYVGYSARDPDVTGILGLAEFMEGIEESWVSPFPDSSARRFFDDHRPNPGRTFWERSITETADEFMRQLSSIW